MIRKEKLDFWVQNNYNVLFVGRHGCGKCLAPNTPLLMYDGSVKLNKDVKKNDLLMGPDSLPRMVLSTTSGEDQMYRITPTKGDSFECNSSHILCIKKAGFDEVLEISVKDFLQKSKRFQRRAMLYRTGVDFDQKTLPQPPYLIGLWLGDETKKKTEITNIDEEIVNYIKLYAEFKKMKVTSWGISHTLSTGRFGKKFGRNEFKNFLRDNKLNEEKHIPFDYKTSSRYDRLQLLAGLVDSDGELHGNSFNIIQKSNILSEDIVFLCRSLGFAAYSKKCFKSWTYKGIVKTGEYNRISIIGDLNEVPCKLLRKKTTIYKSNRNPLKTSFSIESIGKGDYFGFEISGDGRFLLADFTVTHNTAVVKETFESADLNWRYFSASTMDPWVDFVGAPQKVEKDGEVYLDLIRPLDFQQDKVEALFFDEFNRSPSKVRNAVMELLQFKSINGHKFHNLKLVWAAINPEDEEDEYDVERLDPAQKDRFHVCVDMPYEPSLDYFVSKYDKTAARGAVTWWNKLPDVVKKVVSPRRLDYALEFASKNGDLRDVLPAQCNIGELMQCLKFGPIEDKLKELFTVQSVDDSRAFLNNENNYSSSIEWIMKKQERMLFFLPLISREKLNSLVAESHTQKNNKQMKTYRNLIDFIGEHINDIPEFELCLRELADSSKNRSLATTAKAVLSKNLNKVNISDVKIVNKNSIITWAETARRICEETSSTTMRAQAIQSCPYKVGQNFTDEECHAVLKTLNTFAKRSHANTIEGDNTLLGLIKRTVESIKNNNPGMDDREIFRVFMKNKFNLVNKVRNTNKTRNQFGGII